VTALCSLGHLHGRLQPWLLQICGLKRTPAVFLHYPPHQPQDAVSVAVPCKALHIRVHECRTHECRTHECRTHECRAHWPCPARLILQSASPARDANKLCHDMRHCLCRSPCHTCDTPTWERHTSAAYACLSPLSASLAHRMAVTRATAHRDASKLYYNMCHCLTACSKPMSHIRVTATHECHTRFAAKRPSRRLQVPSTRPSGALRCHQTVPASYATGPLPVSKPMSH
jgi:hypothetical protein